MAAVERALGSSTMGSAAQTPSFNKGGWHTCHHQAAGDTWADLGDSAGFPTTTVKPAVTFSLVEGLALNM